MIRTARSSMLASINTNYSWLNSQDFPGGSAGKESACNVGDLDSIPGLGTSPGAGHGNPLWYSGLENFMDCMFHGVAKSCTRLSDSLSPSSIHGCTIRSGYFLCFFGLFFLQACMVFSQPYSDSTQLKAQASPLHTPGAIFQGSSLYSSTLFDKHQPCWLFLTQLHLSLETAGFLTDPPSQNLEAWKFSPVTWVHCTLSWLFPASQAHCPTLPHIQCLTTIVSYIFVQLLQSCYK